MNDLSSIPGVNVCVMGGAGTGKTYSLGTIAESGIDLFVIMLESGIESLIAYFEEKGRPVPPNVHWMTLPASVSSLDLLMSKAKEINTLSYKALCQMDDPKKSQHNNFYKLLEGLNNFKDERTGKEYGSVLTWDSSRCLAIDGLTGISSAAMSLVIGGNPTAMEGEWGIAMGQIERLLRMLCDAYRGHFVLLSHVERETDPVFGGSRISVSTLGKKLAPKIPTMFSEVILATRNGDKWHWDTANSQADLKVRYLPVKADNPPTFAPIIEKWRRRVEAAKPTEKPINSEVPS